jgi:ABC-type phosphate/phosphonate transport system substrate-binding protein
LKNKWSKDPAATKKDEYEKTFISICGDVGVINLYSAGQAAEFKFTAIPDEDTARLQQRFDKVAAYLSKELGIQVTYVPVKSHAATGLKPGKEEKRAFIM